MKENLSKQDIIDRIGYFRNKKRMSAYRLGLELGHSKTYFYRIESGKIQLTLDGLLEVFEILGVSTSEFFCPTIDEKEKELLKTFSHLSEESKNTILDLIKKLK